MARFKVVLTDTTVSDYDVEEQLFARSALQVERTYLRTHDTGKIVRAAADADALIVSWAPISASVIAQLPRCRLIVRYGIGVDMIDLDAATEHGIIVCNTARYCIDEVSTQAITLLLALNRNLYREASWLRAGGWGGSGDSPPRRLHGLQLGLVGFGNIGQAVARKAIGLGLRVVVYDPYLPQIPPDLASVAFVTLDVALSTSDFVSLHSPLNSSTRHLIGARELSLLSSRTYLINTARGGLVDQPALYDALANGQIAGAGLDVFEREPLPADDPLRQLDNVILTPHTAHWSSESSLECRETAVEHVLTMAHGGIPLDIVNKAVLTSDRLRN